MAGLVPATHVFVAEVAGYIETRMPGPSPGKKLLAAKFGGKHSRELPFNSLDSLTLTGILGWQAAPVGPCPASDRLWTPLWRYLMHRSRRAGRKSLSALQGV